MNSDNRSFDWGPPESAGSGLKNKLFAVAFAVIFALLLFLSFFNKPKKPVSKKVDSGSFKNKHESALEVSSSARGLSDASESPLSEAVSFSYEEALQDGFAEDLPEDSLSPETTLEAVTGEAEPLMGFAESANDSASDFSPPLPVSSSESFSMKRPSSGKKSEIYIQLGAFMEQDGALRIQKALREVGTEPVIRPPDDQVEMYRLLLGPYDDMAVAESKADELNSLGFNCFITR